MRPRISRRKIGIAAVAVGLGAAASFLGQPLIHGNEQAINVIVTVFSILAGFLVAIIALVGDLALLPHGTWRLLELNRAQLARRLVRHKWLFFGYLLTLGSIFLSLLLGAEYPNLAVWLERAYLFLATFTFVLSMGLPWALTKLQEERIDALIRSRRREEGIREHPRD